MPLSAVFGTKALLTCPTCSRTYIEATGGELVETYDLLPQFVRNAFTELGKTGLSLGSSSTGLVDRIEHVETQLGALQNSLTDPGARAELKRIRDDVQAAFGNAQAAQGAARVLQDQLGQLTKALADLRLGDIRADVDALETIVRKHLHDHKENNV
jgi:hypothetical protein